VQSDPSNCGACGTVFLSFSLAIGNAPIAFIYKAETPHMIGFLVIVNRFSFPINIFKSAVQ
jgi:hypothetical protein